MDYSSWRNHGCRLFSFMHKGYQFLTLENNLLNIANFGLRHKSITSSL
ncbi:MAG: hypothetical protein BWY62_01270 [Firmicutes bacterium ADurb.Bin356]|nr:MAG: hypothetical protein BWY62_01270 [Firmicutes bacterium ADurb.Bin356]